MDESEPETAPQPKPTPGWMKALGGCCGVLLLLSCGGGSWLAYQYNQFTEETAKVGLQEERLRAEWQAALAKPYAPPASPSVERLKLFGEIQTAHQEPRKPRRIGDAEPRARELQPRGERRVDGARVPGADSRQ